MKGTKYIVDMINSKTTEILNKYFGPNGIITIARKNSQKCHCQSDCDCDCESDKDNECGISERKVVNITQEKIDNGTYFVCEDNVTINICEDLNITSRGKKYAAGVINIMGHNNKVDFLNHKIVADGKIALGIVTGAPNIVTKKFQLTGDGIISGFYYSAVFASGVDSFIFQNTTVTENTATDLYNEQGMLVPTSFVNCTDYVTTRVKITKTVSLATGQQIIVSPMLYLNSYGTVDGLKVFDTTSTVGSALGFVCENLVGDLPSVSISNFEIRGVTATNMTIGVGLLTGAGITGYSPTMDKLNVMNINTTLKDNAAYGIALSGIVNGSITNSKVMMVTNKITGGLMNPTLASSLYAGASSGNFNVDAKEINSTPVT
ncbi:MAG: hypothetical protein Harvfovirus2_39 [Harvfovirus sp.]|uniref:Uncharacterized protein n=1 Tax=Harvfovirus sp. TaxID=2487768 RepID=A0A3G5A4V9_9VIRU|nr:MAG: hypothetical protein Harvfovirus2_39 [Harvfovirus sp.]